MRSICLSLQSSPKHTRQVTQVTKQRVDRWTRPDSTSIAPQGNGAACIEHDSAGDWEAGLRSILTYLPVATDRPYNNPWFQKIVGTAPSRPAAVPIVPEYMGRGAAASCLIR